MIHEALCVLRDAIALFLFGIMLLVLAAIWTGIIQ